MNRIQAHCKEFALVLPGCEYVFIQLKCEHFITNTNIVEITWLSCRQLNKLKHFLYNLYEYREFQGNIFSINPV